MMVLLRFSILLFLLLTTSFQKGVSGSSGSGSSSPFFRHSTTTSWRSSSTSSRPRPPLNPRAQRYLASLMEETMNNNNAETADHDNNNNKVNNKDAAAFIIRQPLRGGQDADAFVKVVGAVTEIVVLCGKLVLPPVVAFTKLVANIYQSLPMDAIVAQVGLVYCFAGGYYPTLFSSLQAAQLYGWNTMVQSISELMDEAVRVMQAVDDVKTSKFGFSNTNDENDELAELKRRASSFRDNTCVVLATVDPVKINQAAAALYTTWLGVFSVLEHEYARVITLSMAMSDFLEEMANFLVAPAVRLCLPEDYHQWIPVVIGWGCKALAMNIAWRIQRLMTAATSAVTGGLLFARATSRMLSKRGIRLFGLIKQDDEKTHLDEVIGFLVAGLGFYTQFEAQWRSGFSFRVPFPFYLVTWPFDWAEKWIQWQITK